MFGLDDLAEDFIGGSAWGLGLAAGIAAVTLGGRGARPVAKRAIKGYLAATRRVREFGAEAGEQLQDLYAEAKHEYEAAPAQSEAPGGKRRSQPAEASA